MMFPSKLIPALFKLKALAADDVNIQAILFGSPTTQHINMLSDKLIKAFIAFSWHRCNNMKPNLEIANHAVSMARAFENKRYIASSLWCLGKMYGFLGEYSVAYHHLQEAYKLYNALLPGTRNLQRLCCQCGISMVDGAYSSLTFKDGGNVVSLARDVEKQAATVSDELEYIYARSLVMLGRVLNRYGHRQEALNHLERAKLMDTGASALSSDIHYSIVLVHHHDNRLPEALDAAKEAWKLSDPYTNDLVRQAQNSFLLGMILFNVNRDTEAWKYL